MNKNIIKDTLKLVSITLIAGVLLSFVYQLTKDTIDKAEAEELQQSYREAFPMASDFEETNADASASLDDGNTLNSALYAKDDSGNVLGCVLSITSHNGYGGDIVLTMGVDKSGVITGVKVTSMGETSGLGANCQNDEWIAQYSGISGRAEFTKTGKSKLNEIDAISGATITTRAVTSAVNSGLKLAEEQFGFSENSEGSDKE